MALPSTIRMEASSRCQLKCPACPTATKAIDPTLGSGVLKFSDFKQFVLKNPQVEVIEISNYGEVFLNPELLHILRFAHEQGVVIRIGNGANLNNVSEEMLEALVRYKVERITCSIDGASQETYSQYRVRGNYDRVIGHIRRINHFKAIHRSKFPHLRWQFIIFGHNEHEIPKARELARELDMEMHFKLSWDSDFSPIRNEAWVRKELGMAVTNREDYSAQTGRDYVHDICHQLWSNPQINWDGKNLGCGRNFWGDFGGNAFKDGLSALLNHEKMSYARKMLQGQASPREDIPCSTCSNYHLMRTNKKWVPMRLDRVPFWKTLARKIKNIVEARMGTARLRRRKAVPAEG